MTMPTAPRPIPSPWPHRCAVCLACTTFPLIWVGGLVTTYDAGMAVPDWPNTYGYNLFAYPWQTWLFGPWDLFLEHSHRLLGALVGLITMAVVVAVYRSDQRLWLRRLALVALGAVIAQGCLGGVRVLLDARLLAMLHGIVAPGYFALSLVLCVATSAWWHAVASPAPSRDPTASPGPPRRDGARQHERRGSEYPPAHRRLAAACLGLYPLGVTTLAAVYLQVALGALLRHIPVGASPGLFRYAVFLHLIIAALVTIGAGLLWWQTRRRPEGAFGLRGPATALALLVACQLVLGCLTWLVSYWWPGWAADFSAAVPYNTIHAKGAFQSWTATGHAATGALILGLATLLAVRAGRLAGRSKGCQP